MPHQRDCGMHGLPPLAHSAATLGLQRGLPASDRPPYYLPLDALPAFVGMRLPQGAFLAGLLF